MAAIGVVTFCRVMPWVSPALIRAILANAATSRDFPYTPATWLTAFVLVVGFAGTGMVDEEAANAENSASFYFVGYGTPRRIAFVRQPSRYELEIDIALPVAAIFGGARYSTG